MAYRNRNRNGGQAMCPCPPGVEPPGGQPDPRGDISDPWQDNPQGDIADPWQADSQGDIRDSDPWSIGPTVPEIPSVWEGTVIGPNSPKPSPMMNLDKNKYGNSRRKKPSDASVDYSGFDYGWAMKKLKESQK